MIKREIKEFIYSEINEEGIDEQTDLIDSGILSSLEFLKLLSSIEEEFEVSVDFGEVDPTELTTVEHMASTFAQISTKKSTQANTSNDENGTKIIFVGNGRPIQHVLSNIETIEGLHLSDLYTSEDNDSKVIKQAHRLGIETHSTEKLRTNNGSGYFESNPPDYIFSVNSEFIFPEDLLSAPKIGCLNMHPGKLPEYAGMYAHQWALINNANEFGATLHWMTSEIDAGPIAYRETFKITENDTGLKLFLRSIDTGSQLVIKALNQIVAGEKPPKTPQNTQERNLYRINDLPDGEIDWTWTARYIYDFVRAADYRPFNSPTYQPYFKIEDEKIIIREVDIIDITEVSSGEVHQIDNGLVVGTEDKAIKILQMEANERQLTSQHLKAEYGIKSGMDLSQLD